jgi:hypothetical protein
MPVTTAVRSPMWSQVWVGPLMPTTRWAPHFIPKVLSFHHGGNDLNVSQNCEKFTGEPVDASGRILHGGGYAWVSSTNANLCVRMAGVGLPFSSFCWHWVGESIHATKKNESASKRQRPITQPKPTGLMHTHLCSWPWLLDYPLTRIWHTGGRNSRRNAEPRQAQLGDTL